MNNKEIVINELVFKFEFNKEGGVWYLGYNEFDIFNLGYATNITISEKQPNWESIVIFLKFITNDTIKFKKRILFSSLKLKDYFIFSYKNIDLEVNYNDVFFTLCNIDYKGITVECFNYILNFNVGLKNDDDFFMYDSWNAHFINTKLVDLTKS